MDEPTDLFCAGADLRRSRGYDSDWGGWRLEGLEQVYPAYGRNVYPINIERLTTSAPMLDTIMQVAGKRWATNDCIAGPVHAQRESIGLPRYWI